jgi:hypothetical protein
MKINDLYNLNAFTYTSLNPLTLHLDVRWYNSQVFYLQMPSGIVVVGVLIDSFKAKSWMIIHYG